MDLRVEGGRSCCQPGPAARAAARLMGKRRAACGGAERCRLEPVKKL
ncbi:hypothetical protein [Streptosporangium sp. 'caverna']|nr:hypothetical protein [Streptosporangium sp. 'caverna']